VYLPNERNTFKLLAGEAYRVPSAYEKHYNDGTYISNTALQAETIRTVEGIFERRLDQQQLLGMSLHQYQFKSLITQVDAGNSQLRYENQSGVSSKALELFWKKLRTNDASLFASISLNRVQVESGERFPNSPNWLAKFRATQALGSPLWIAALEVDAVGPREIEATTGQVALGTQWWVNATVNTTALGRGVRLQWRVINLLDRQVQLVSPDAVTSFVPLNRRSLQMTLVYDW
jgi:iron complex outermembrane receptor protein